MDPAVSVCVPTWNGAAYLEETLRSALGQTFDDFELIVVDDGSSDRTMEIVESFGDRRLLIHRNPRRLGLPGNWNLCLELARGRYVKFLFQDDVLLPEALGELVGALQAVPEAPLAFGRREIRYFGPGLDEFPLQGGYYAEILQSFYASFDGRVTGAEFIASALREDRDIAINVVGEPSFVLLRRDSARALGGFHTGFLQLSDWDLWLRLARQGPLVFVDRCLGVFRVHPRGQSASPRHLRRVPWENVKLMARMRQLYGPELNRALRRQLRRAEWKHRAHFVMEALRRLTRVPRA
jgi:glycosyltransferase involved in cell wall biosynthesis